MKILALKLLESPENNIQDRKRFKNIIKGLTSTKPYYFYQNYKLTNDCVLVKEEKVLPFIDNYFDPLKPNVGLSINVCAIVGKNGSGKSSIIELMIRIINNFACSIIGDIPIFNSAHPLHFIPDIFAELYYEVDKIFYKIQQRGDEVYLFKSGNEEYLYCNKHDGYQWCNNRIPPILKESELKNLFYTIVVNYSHYSYNLYDYKSEWSSIDVMKGKLGLSDAELEKRKKEGKPEILDIERCWLTGIFHKNDGYQTPIVLNPYRYDGNIDIKKEGDLERDRLLSLILSMHDNDQSLITEVIENKIVSSIDITISESHRTIKNKEYRTEKLEEYYNQTKSNNLAFADIYDEIVKQWSKLYGIYFKKNIFEDNYTDLHEIALNYLVYKTLRITWQYNEYSFFYSDLINNNRELPLLVNDLVKRINEDKSHVTLKIRQTISFLLCHHIIPQESKVIVMGKRINQALNNDLRVNIPIFQSWTESEAAQSLDLNHADGGAAINFNPKIIDMLPPPFFKVNMKLIDRQKSEFEFQTLSSGEKQMIYTIGSVLYHLNNVDSVREKGDSDNIYYPHINIILEEIELYYHPEMQRKLISHLINSIKKINLKVKSIQILLVTHSPFVLSDIPCNNILYLENGTPRETPISESFGANIFELLKDSFYLNDGPLGVHSYCILKKMFEMLSKSRLKKSDLAYIKRMADYIGEPFLKDELIKLITLKEKQYDTN